MSTKLELRLRHELWHHGFRYKVNDKRLPGRPDIVLPKYRTVIFVHGCFWYGHKTCKCYTVPKTNTEFWAAKVAWTQERDHVVWRNLEAKGGGGIIVWEYQVKKSNLEVTVKRVADEIVQNGETYRTAKDERRKALEVFRGERMVRKKREDALMREITKK